MKPVIEVINISKRYEEVLAVRDISFSVSSGSIFALAPVGGIYYPIDVLPVRL